jgi:hypothetical protein
VLPTERIVEFIAGPGVTCRDGGCHNCRVAMRSADADALAAALTAAGESRRTAFLRAVGDVEPGGWCELLKDVAALANSGGGVVVVGVEGNGTPSGWDPAAFLATGTAALTDAFAEFAGEPFAEFEIAPGARGSSPVAGVVVQPRFGSPIVFQKAGTYRIESRRRTSFARGTVYFRHGTSSEPGTSRDLERFVHREVERQRRAWRANVRKAAAAPAEARVLVVKRNTATAPPTTDVRVVDDPDAPVFGRADFDVTHPHRQRDVIRLVNAALDRSINQFDLLSVKRIHAVEDEARFFHKPRFSSPQYSDAFVTWLIDSSRADPAFFDDARAAYQATRARPRADES